MFCKQRSESSEQKMEKLSSCGYRSNSDVALKTVITARRTFSLFEVCLTIYLEESWELIFVLRLNFLVFTDRKNCIFSHFKTF